MEKKQPSENNTAELEGQRKVLDETQTNLRLLRSIVNSSPAVVCLWRVDDDWSVEFISDGIGQFGYSPEDLLSGKIAFRDFILLKDMSRIKTEVAQYFEQGVDKYTQEYRISTRSGKIRWVEERNIVIRDPGGRITHVQAMIFDITKRKRMEMELRESAASLNAAQQLAKVGSWRWDLDTGQFSMSDEMLRIHGLPPGNGAEDVRSVVESMVHPDDRVKIRGMMEEVIAGGAGRDVSFRIVRPDGEVRWLEASGPGKVQVLDNTGPPVLMGAVRDITERKQAEEQLRQSEQRYRKLFEGAGEGMLVADIETRKLILANPAACNMLNYNVEELLEMTVEDLHHPEDLSHVVDCFQAQVRGDYQVAQAVPFRTRDGEVIYADVSAVLIRFEDRNCAVGLLRDLTEARRTEEALQTAYMKLMNARDEERKYLASELHDSVSQKLVALAMRLNDIALSGPKLPPEPGYELLKAAVTCNELITDIKGICHGLYPPVLESLGLVAAMKQLEEYCLAAGLTAAISCDPVIAQRRFGPEIEIACFRIAQEAVNNAIRHSRGTNIDIDLTYTNGQLVLAIIDDGEGFDVQAAGGASFGLNSMRDRARAVGAKLAITSEPGETRIEVVVEADLEETSGKKG